MEPKGVLTDELLRMAQTWQMRDRLVYIDPIDCPVSINLFEKGDGSDQALTDSMAMAEYVISILASGITDLQRGPFSYVLRLMFVIPGVVSIETLDDILRTGAANYPEALSSLTRTAQRFFQLDWNNDTQVKANASQLRARINTILADPIFEKLLYTDRSTFDLLDAIQGGKLILINANQNRLGEGRPTEMYGRFWIAQMYKAALRRLAIIKDGGRLVPTAFLIEAQVFVAEDQRLRGILGIAREAQIGAMFAMHHMGDITDQQVRDSIYTNTALKFVARTTADIHNLCRSMGNTQPDFLRRRSLMSLPISARAWRLQSR